MWLLRVAAVGAFLGCVEAAHGSAPLQNDSLVWQPLFEPGCGGDIVSVRVSPLDPAVIFMSGDMLGLTVSHDQGNSWLSSDGETRALLSYEMNDFTVDEVCGRVYVGSLSGVYVSDASDGVAWSSLRNGLPAPGCCGYNAVVQKVLVDPSNCTHLLAFAGSKRNWSRVNASVAGSVWESFNAGASWAFKSVVVAGGNIVNADWVAGSSGRSVWAAVDGSGMYRSDDGGATWAAANAGLPNGSIPVGFAVAHPSNGSIAYVSLCWGGVYRTDTGGAMWFSVTTGLPASGCYSALGIARSAPDTLYIGCNGCNSSQMWKTVDGGATWATLTGAPAAEAYGLQFQASFLDVDPSDADAVYYATWVTLFASQDGGATWRDVTAFQPFPDATGTVWRGTGFSGLVATNFKWNPFAPDMAVLQAMDAGKIWVSTDGLYSWRRQSGLQLFGGGNDVTFAADGMTMYAGTGQYGWPASLSIEGVVRSGDGGVTWSYCGYPNISGTMMVTSLYTLPYNASNVWAIFQDGRLYFSSNACASWTALSGVNDTLLSLAAPRRANASPDPRNAIMYAAGFAGVWNTSNGFDFNLLPRSPTAWQYSVNHAYVSQADDATVWAANGNWDQWHSALWRRNASSGEWAPFLMGDTTVWAAADSPVTDAPASAPCIIAVASNRNPYPEVSDATGVHLSVDGGRTWAQQTLGLPVRRVSAIACSPDGRKLVVGLNGRGFFWADTAALQPACDDM